MKAGQYIQSYQGYFWQWEEDGEVLTIPAADTIAYRQFIVEVLAVLAPQGFPPFGSLLLVLSATNPNGGEAVDVVNAIVRQKLQSPVDEELDGAVGFLKMLADLPQAYKQGSKRVLLLQALFQDCHKPVSAKDSADILSALSSQAATATPPARPIEFSEANCKKDFRTIFLLARRFPDLDSVLRAITSLPEFPADPPALEEKKDSESAGRDLVEQLMENRQTFKVAALIKRIWSCIKIPMHHNQASQQSFGGVADISNKGDFDKLLHHEFANDDFVFLSRLANREVLFFNREIPQADKDIQRTILIDISLKNWGTIKSIAFSVMLAIAKHPRSVIECRVILLGESYRRVSVANVDDIIDALQILDVSLNAASGLAAYIKEHDTRRQELILIAGAEAIAYPKVQKLLNESHAPIDYWIHPTSEGRVDVYNFRNKKKNQIQTFNLPLKELWDRKFSAEDTDDLQLEVKDYPMLFPNPGFKRTICTVDGSIYGISKEKCLLRKYGLNEEADSKGWEILYDDLDFCFGEFALGFNEAGEDILLMFNPQNREIVLLNISSGERRRFMFGRWHSVPSRTFFFYRACFCYVGHHHYWKIHLDGHIEEISISSDEFTDIIDSRKKGTAADRQIEARTQQVFKNVKTVFINERSELVFNTHRLYVSQAGMLKMDALISSASRQHSANWSAEGEFTFSDGSRVKVNRLGMLILRSSDESIPTIFIASVLGRSLGLATDYDFAGNEYYFKSPQYAVTLESIANNRQKLEQVLKNLLAFDEQAVRQLIEDTPALILKTLSEGKATTLKIKLEKVGAVIGIQRSGKPMNMLSAADFYSRHIQAFIDQIRNYAA